MGEIELVAQIGIDVSSGGTPHQDFPQSSLLHIGSVQVPLLVQKERDVFRIWPTESTAFRPLASTRSPV